MNIKVGSRGSRLALNQTKIVCDHISASHPGVCIEIVTVSTHGDQDQRTPLYEMPQTGVFVKAVEKALIEKKIDMAVHSLKDVSSNMDERLMILGYASFEDKRDALLSKGHKKLVDLRLNAIIGTSSIRRMACIHKVRPDIQFVNLRGNVEKRIQKMETEALDGIILAVAGLKRLNLDGRIDEILNPSVIVPACGQGTLAIQIRKEDAHLYRGWLPEEVFGQEAQIEREFLRLTQAGCHDPVGCSVRIHDQRIDVHACLGTSIEDCTVIHMNFPIEEKMQVAQKVYQCIQEERR